MTKTSGNNVGLPAPRIRVLIVNYNAGHYLKRCVQALLNQTICDFEAVIVDNGSTDGSLLDLPDDPRLRIDLVGRNIGFAAANNRAAQGADATFLAFLNPDAIPEPSWLAHLVAAADDNPDVALFGSLQLLDDNPDLIDGAGDTYFISGTAWRMGRYQRAETARGWQSVFGACAAAALMRRDWFERLEGFDPDYFCYFEDVDLAFRLRLLGGRVMQVNDAVVRHAGSAITGAGSDFVVYHTVRNQLWTFLKAMPSALLILLLPLHVAMLLAKWLGAARQHRGGVVARALRDGLLGMGPVLAKRRKIQSGRRATNWDIASAMTWSLPAFFRRSGPGR